MRRLGHAVLRIMAVFAVISVPALVPTASHALGDTIGTLTITPGSGSDTTPLTVGMSAPCPGGTHVMVRIFGSGFVAGGYNVVAPAEQRIYPVNPAGGSDLPLQNTLKYYSELVDASKPTSAPLSGVYTLRATCRDTLRAGGNSGEGYGDFVGTLTFGTPTSYTTNAVEEVAPRTETTLSSSLVSITRGASVTLKSTVTPPSAEGTVQFMDGAAQLGEPVAVVSGAATLTTVGLAGGNRQVQAFFRPTSAKSFLASASPRIVISVNESTSTGANATATTFAVSPSGTAIRGASVVLSAAVSPSDATGSIEFKRGTTLLEAVPVVGGVASATVTDLPIGALGLTAAFKPTGNFRNSTSPSVRLVVTAPSSSSAVPSIAPSTSATSAAQSASPTAGPSQPATQPATPSSSSTASASPSSSPSASSSATASEPPAAEEPQAGIADSTPTPSATVLGTTQSASDQGATGTSNGGQLAQTGVEVGRLVLLGCALILLGAAAVRYARQRGFTVFDGR